MNKRLLFLVVLSLTFSSCVFAASSKHKKPGISWAKAVMRGTKKPQPTSSLTVLRKKPQTIRSPRASTPAKIPTPIQYPSDDESGEERLSLAEAAQAIGRVRESTVKMPPEPDGLRDIVVTFDGDGFVVHNSVADTPDWATLADEMDSYEDEHDLTNYTAAFGPNVPVASSIEDINQQIITLTKQIALLESPKEFEEVGDKEAQEKMIEHKRSALKAAKKERGTILLDRRTSYKQDVAFKTTPKPAGVTAKIAVDKTQQHTPSATVPIFDMNEKPRTLDGAKAPLNLLAVIQAPDALDISEKEAAPVRVTTPVAPDAEVVAAKEAAASTPELAIKKASAPAPLITEEVKEAVPVAPKAQHPAFAGTLSDDFKAELAKLSPTVLTLHTETGEEGYASFHDREVRPQVKEKELYRTLPYSAKSTLPQALMRKQVGKKEDKTLTLAQLLALKGINVDESEAQKYFEDHRESILGHDVGSLPEVIIPEAPDRIELLKEAKAAQEDAYYKALQKERDRTRSIKDDLYEKARRLTGTAQEVQQRKADTFNAKRQALLDTMHKHETDHDLPNTKSWGSTLAALNPWG